MIQLTIDDNLKTTLIIGSQQFVFDSATIYVDPGNVPDIKIDGLCAVFDKTENDTEV